MSLLGCAVTQQHGVMQDLFLAAANLANRDEFGSLILNRVGRILSGGVAAERVFGASEDRLIGRRISELVMGLVLDGNSPSDTARYLTSLWADGKWRHFEAIETGGRRFDVELSLSRMMTDGEEIFLVNLRRRDMRTMADAMAAIAPITADRNAILNGFPDQSEPADSRAGRYAANEVFRAGGEQVSRLAAHER